MLDLPSVSHYIGKGKELFKAAPSPSQSPNQGAQAEEAPHQCSFCSVFPSYPEKLLRLKDTAKRHLAQCHLPASGAEGLDSAACALKTGLGQRLQGGNRLFQVTRWLSAWGQAPRCAWERPKVLQAQFRPERAAAKEGQALCQHLGARRSWKPICVLSTIRVHGQSAEAP